MRAEVSGGVFGQGSIGFVAKGRSSDKSFTVVVRLSTSGALLRLGPVQQFLHALRSKLPRLRYFVSSSRTSGTVSPPFRFLQYASTLASGCFVQALSDLRRGCQVHPRKVTNLNTLKLNEAEDCSGFVALYPQIHGGVVVRILQVGANRQVIVYFFPTADRLVFVASHRQLIVLFSVGCVCTCC